MSIPVPIFPDDEEYDVVVCGTGLKECILSSLMSMEGKKVLHLDRNSYYGGDCASLNLTNLYKKFNKGEPPSHYGADRDWNVDLIPKFIMASGKLVRMLFKAKVADYLEWRLVEGTYVYQYQKAGFFSSEKYIHKVPASDSEALNSNLLSMAEKLRCRSFFQFVSKFDINDPSTHGKYNPNVTTMRKVYDDFGLCDTTIAFIGHAVALYSNDDYIDQPMAATFERMKLYFFSFAQNQKSPFVYPAYGLQGLPEAFSRRSAIMGGTYMLNKAIKGFEFDDDGKVCGVVAETGETVKTKMVICDPSYVDEQRKQQVGMTVRAICILSAPIPHTKDAQSCQIIIPQSEVGRKNDIFIMLVSGTHEVCKRGKYLAILSTVVETDVANATGELKPAFDLLGPKNVEERFVYITRDYVPKSTGQADNIFVTKSYDAESHFEGATEDVFDVYKRIMGKELCLESEEENKNE